jgi:endonuclease G
MKKLIAVFMIGLVLPFTAFAEKTPCWGEGGISHCEGSRFVCNNGKTSVSKKICSGYDKKKIVKDKHAIDKSIKDKPAIDKPVIDKSIKDKPAIDKPVIDKSIKDKPVIDKPVKDKPVIDKPVIDKSIKDKPVIDKPVIDKSIKDKPVVDKPVIDKSVTDKPAHVDIDITDSETVKKTEVTKSGELLKLEYQGFTLWLDCEKRSVMKFQYNVQHGTENEPGAKNFKLDPSVPKECQQTSAAAYGHGYDYGRLVPANHLDNSSEAMTQSNYMTNILPQTLQMKQGAWLLIEELIECYRDIDKLLVIGGVIWGDNPANDYFVQSHGVKTPDAFWKVIIRSGEQDEQAMAWVVPNSKDATRNNLDNYLVSLGELEIITGEKIPVAYYLKNDKPSASWIIPAGCKKE